MHAQIIINILFIDPIIDNAQNSIEILNIASQENLDEEYLKQIKVMI